MTRNKDRKRDLTVHSWNDETDREIQVKRERAAFVREREAQKREDKSNLFK